MTARPVLNQISLSCIDLLLSEQWFREGLGLIPAGGTWLTPDTSSVCGVPDAQAICWWMVGGNPHFRISLVQFSEPFPRLLPADFQPSDLGYTRIGVSVADMELTLENLARLGSTPIGPVLGIPSERRACIRNPDGVFIELIERSPLPGTPPVHTAMIHSVTLSTPDLDASAAYFSAVSGKLPESRTLRDHSHEAMWGLSGASCRYATFDFGHILLELVQYTDPVGRPKPEGFKSSDQGVSELGFTSSSVREHAEIIERMQSVGARFGDTRLDTPERGWVHASDQIGAAIELSWSTAIPVHGFEPLSIGARPTPGEFTIHATSVIAASFDQVWVALNDHDRMDQWIEADTFTVTKEGTPFPGGYGAERLLATMGREVGQQVTYVGPRQFGYRAISGTPFSYHNGTVDVSESEDGVQLDWHIRFRTHSPPIALQVYPELLAGIQHMLGVFKAMVEAEEQD